MPEDKILFTAPKLRRFKKATLDAEAAGETEFTYEGHQFMVAYAKYLVTYLETSLRDLGH